MDGPTDRRTKLKEKKCHVFDSTLRLTDTHRRRRILAGAETAAAQPLVGYSMLLLALQPPPCLSLSLSH